MIKHTSIKNINLSDGYVIVDKLVAELHNISATNCLAVESGEGLKTFSKVEKIASWLLDHNANKNDTVYAIGGGTVGDTVGLACSIYKRGIKVVHVPTTLVAMVDSAIGGKTAVNLCNVKNAVGTIYMGDTVIDTSFLATLPASAILDGMGEVYKYKLLNREIDNCKNNDLDKLVELCSNFKQKIVDLDPYDNAERRCLNMGHTVAHAIELANNISHGQAVAIGLYYELWLAEQLQLVEAGSADKYRNKHAIVPVTITLSMISAMCNDKKNNSEKISFVLPKDSYDYKFVQLDKDEVISLLGAEC